MSSTLRGNTALTTAPVPRDIADWVRLYQRKPSINMMVENFHIDLIADPEYVRLLDATHHEQAVEGNMRDDDHEAAVKIRAAATKANSPLAKEKLATIIKALNTVLNKYGMSRYQRRMGFTAQSAPPAVEPNGEDNNDSGDAN